MDQKPILIAGPCSAESRKQVLATAAGLQNVDYFRAGIWKPRSRPGSFEGIGRRGLSWLSDVQQIYGLKVCTEVAKPKHVEQVLKAGIKAVWLGARTTTNPFMVQELVKSFQGVEDLTVFVKNPVNPDLSLWIGAIERVSKAGIENILAVHRGFSHFQASIYRNSPLWFIPIELKVRFPHIPLICDPSHMGGDIKYVPSLSQKAIDLGFDGLMVEVHPDAPNALSDPAQQLSPEAFNQMVSHLHQYIRTPSDDNASRIKQKRLQIDLVDEEIIESLARRFRIVEQIGGIKQKEHISFLQVQRWNEISKHLRQLAEENNLGADFVEQLYQIIHYEAIKRQQANEQER